MRSIPALFLLFVAVLVATPALSQSVLAPKSDVLSENQWRQIDRAAARGLRFLASQQRRDGSFNTHRNGQMGVTGLATLAFLANGHLPGSGPYGDTLDLAVDFMMRSQKKNGLLSTVGPTGRLVKQNMNHEVGVATAYSHAIAGLALSETYAMQGGNGQTEIDDKLQETIERAIAAAVVMQRWQKTRAIDQGGWRYMHPFDAKDSDLSIVGWYLKFLRSAKNSGFDVPDKSVDAAVGYVLRCFTPSLGTFEYSIGSNDSRTRAMAGVGILALAHTSRHNRPEADAAADFILKNGFTRYNRQAYLHGGHNNDRYHYGVFYCSQAMYQIGGRHWKAFFPPTARTLVENQNQDGSWQAEQGQDSHYGRVYTTALSLLALGAPNQLLPIYQR